jgi:putative oxidoreductase
MTPHKTDPLASLGLLVLRLGFGGYMLTHGLGKIERFRDGADFDPIGIGSTASLLLIIFAEVVCALLIMLGLLTRLATVPLIIAMGVAAFVAHGNDPWTAGEGARLYREGLAQHWGSKQPALMFLSAYVALLLTGPGRMAVDALLWPRVRARLRR